MGRPPCCDKVAVKKGPWTPEEDVKLASYIHEHGSGNWRAVPSNIGLMRCSKSCRLRWTNYLRPGIKHGKFSDKEDKLIIELQALLGNRWAAIAWYMPQRTDNGIKNYWNTHLKKRLLGSGRAADGSTEGGGGNKKAAVPKCQWEHRLQTDLHTARQALHETLSLASMPTAPAPVTYASSLENISRLREGWICPVGIEGSKDMAPDKSAGSTKQLKSTLTLKELTPRPTAQVSMANPSRAENNGCLLEGWMSPVSSGVYGEPINALSIDVNTTMEEFSNGIVPNNRVAQVPMRALT